MTASTSPPQLHADPACNGPVRFTLRGGFCQRCQAGPLHPYADNLAARYVHRDDELTAAGMAANLGE
jgi:hypothetical protein